MHGTPVSLLRRMIPRRIRLAYSRLILRRTIAKYECVLLASGEAWW